jgi:hypothetical protein
MRRSPAFRHILARTGVAVFFFGLTAFGQTPPAVIGEVEISTSATLNGAPLPGGVTIFDGDVVATGPNGEAVVRLLPDDEVVLNEKTSVAFSKAQDRVRLILRRGTLVLQNNGKGPVAVVTPKFVIQPAQPGNARLYVGLMADQSTYIEASQGNMLIVDESSGKSYLLLEGQNTLVPRNASGIPGLQPRQSIYVATSKPNRITPSTEQRPRRISTSHNHHLAIGLGIAAAAAGGVTAMVAKSGSGSAPSVSPSVP